MALRTQNKKIIYRFVFILLSIAAFGGIFYYNKLIKDKYSVETKNVPSVVKKFIGDNFNADILKTKKFKELKEIPLKKVNNKQSEELTVDELARLKLMARYSNPFKPFDTVKAE